MSKSRNTVRVVVIGDDGCGKTSLISSYIGTKHDADVLPEVVVPPHLAPERVTVVIVDTSSKADMRSTLETEIKRSTVIVCVYDINSQDAHSRVASFWLPYIRRLGANVPVILVANKADKKGSSDKQIEEDMTPIMNEWKEIDTCLEASAETGLNVPQLLYFAIKAATVPVSPLYDTKRHVMKKKCADALKRIFLLSDLDQDGLLNDEELNKFQVECFNVPLQPQEISALKSVILEGDQDGIQDDSLTLEGFKFLHKIFIESGRAETTWQILGKFGYGLDLELREDFLCPKKKISKNQTVELSLIGLQFFTDLFEKFDRDKNGALNETELSNLFQTSPGNPWGDSYAQTTVTNKLNEITLKGFLGLWAMTTMLDYKVTLRYLAYLGFKGDTTDALRVIKTKNITNQSQQGGDQKSQGNQQSQNNQPEKEKKITAKSVINCFVFGKEKSGKTSLLKRHVNSTFKEKYSPTKSPLNVVNTVDVKGSEKHLVLQEIGEKVALEVIKDAQKMESADVMCFLYDSSDDTSFEFVANLFNEIKKEYKSTPCCFVATKRDLDLIQQRHLVQPDDFCKQNGLLAPIAISVKNPKDSADIYSVIVGIALEPQQHLPHVEIVKPQRNYYFLGVAIGSTLSFAGVAFYLFMKYFPKNQLRIQSSK